MAIDVTSFEQIAPILSQLATNYSNIFFDYFNLFYNPTEMDITIEYYDIDGNLNTITIPNRAKDRSYILNGNGNPEGAVSGVKGSIYQDLTNGILYIKQSAQDQTGWMELMTLDGLNNFLMQGNGTPEGVVTASNGTLYVDLSASALYIKTTETGNTGWVMISTDTENLANRDLSNLTITGEAHFANPDLSNLSLTGQGKLDAKENISNKVTSMSSGSTDTQYPSAKAVYDALTSTAAPLANKDLSNLTATGEDHFVRIETQVRDCIFKAPNGLPSVSGNVISLPSGTTLLCANGVDGNRAVVNSKYTTLSALSVSVSWTGANEGIVFYNKNTNNLIYYAVSAFNRGIEAPVGEANMIWLNPNINKYKITSNSGSTWSEIEAVEIGRFSTNNSGNISEFAPRHPLVVATMDDLNIINKLVHNIDEIVADLNGKADVDLTNVNNSGTSRGASWGMPSSTYEDLTLGAAGSSYTAPANGWVQLTGDTNANDQNVYIKSTISGLESSFVGIAFSGIAFSTVLPVQKDEVFQVYYGSITNYTFRFYYAQGSESEAS